MLEAVVFFRGVPARGAEAADRLSAYLRRGVRLKGGRREDKVMEDPAGSRRANAVPQAEPACEALREFVSGLVPGSDRA